MYNAGLVLEGGGMKGVYTSGVLDFFLDKEIEFSCVYGVSAGACNMTSFISKQRGRSKDVFLDYIGMKQYMSVYSLLTTGNLFGADLNFNLVPNYLNPFDYEAFNEYRGDVYSVVTNIKTGEAEYKKITNLEKEIDYIRASSALPLVSKNVVIDKIPYLDGGIADPIPIRESKRNGNVKNVVIMTKPVGYVRKPEKVLPLIKSRYLRYPKLYELMRERHITYNATVDYLNRLEQSGEVFVIRPKEDIAIDRTEKDRSKLEALYNEGYKEAKELYKPLLEYLNS